LSAVEASCATQSHSAQYLSTFAHLTPTNPSQKTKISHLKKTKTQHSNIIAQQNNCKRKNTPSFCKEKSHKKKTTSINELVTTIK